eukprot:9142463-Pyramimonas_sp.AAC.1
MADHRTRMSARVPNTLKLISYNVVKPPNAVGLSLSVNRDRHPNLNCCNQAPPRSESGSLPLDHLFAVESDRWRMRLGVGPGSGARVP